MPWPYRGIIANLTTISKIIERLTYSSGKNPLPWDTSSILWNAPPWTSSVYTDFSLRERKFTPSTAHCLDPIN